MEEEKAESYRALYRVRPLIYHIGDIRLWVPIRQDGIILWLVYIGIFFVLCYIIPIIAWIIPLDRTIVMLVGPILAAYYSVKLDPAGKSVPRFLQDLLRFHLRPKWMIRWQAMRFTERKQKVRFQGRCRSYVLRKEGNEGELWRGSGGRISGRVASLHVLHLPAFYQLKWRGRRNHMMLLPISAKSDFVQTPSTFSVRKKQFIRFSTHRPIKFKFISRMRIGIGISGQLVMKESETMDERMKPKVKLVGQDGNVFSIIGSVVKALQQNGYSVKAKEFQNRAFACGSYDEVLRLVMEFVDVE